MSKQGYIKLHRQLQDCWIWNNEKFSMGQAWVDLLLRASHKDTKIYIDGVLEDIPRGTFVTSIAKLSDAWKWDRKKTTKFLDLLENDKMITRVSTTHRTTVTIENYGIYQDLWITEGQQEPQPLPQQIPQPLDNDGITEGQPLPTINNDNNVKECKRIYKNEKNEKKIEAYFPMDEKLNEAFLAFLDMRKKIKKPATDKAIKLLINKLNKMSGGNNDLAIQIIEQSIVNSWQDLYELKSNNKNSNISNRVKGVDDWV